MKRIFLLACMAAGLTACAAQPPASGLPPATPASTPRPTPEPAWSLTETFRPTGWAEPVTVTVAAGEAPGAWAVTVAGEDGGAFQTLLAETGGPRPSLLVEDMDFDGYLDFRLNYDSGTAGFLSDCWLWDWEAGRFVRAPDLEGVRNLSFDGPRRVVRGGYANGAREGSLYCYRWIGEGLYLQRAVDYGVNWREDGTPGEYTLTVLDCEPGTAPAGEWDREKTAMAVRLHAAFEDWAEWDAAMDRWEDPAYRGEAVEATKTIPDSLLIYLCEPVERGEYGTYLDWLSAGRELEGGEAAELWKIYGDPEEGWGGAYGLAADGDNDGVEDRILLMDRGTGHFTTLYYLRGQLGGGYALTETASPFCRGDWAWCFSWEGANYLACPYDDRDSSRRFQRLDLYRLENGKFVERAYLSRDLAGGTVSEHWAAGGYEAVADGLAAEGAAIWSAYDETERQRLGTAERPAPEEDVYFCDWDNDGVEDTVQKALGGSNASGRALASSLNGTLPESGGLHQMLWFDAFEGETLTILADNFGDGPVVFTAWRGSAEGWEPAARVALEPVYTVEARRSGGDPREAWRYG